MAMISDILLFAGAIGAAFYCFVLSRRLRRFTDLERGVGGAVAVLSAQVDDLQKVLQAAQGTARKSVARLDDVSGRAEGAANRLELMMAALHDLPQAAPPSAPSNPFFMRAPDAVPAQRARA